jgi:hypothetical protein
VQELEIWSLEERFGGANRIGRISDDDIICSFVFCEKLEAVANEHCNFGGNQERRHVREVFLGDTNNSLRDKIDTRLRNTVFRSHLIYVAKYNLLDSLVLQDLSNNPTVAASYN